MRQSKSWNPDRIITVGFSVPAEITECLVKFRDSWLKEFAVWRFWHSWTPNSQTLNLFQIAPESNHRTLLGTLIWTYLLSRHPCWSQHFPPLLLHSVRLSVCWLWPLTWAQQLQQQDIVVSSWMDAKPSSPLICGKVSPNRYKDVEIKQNGRHQRWGNVEKTENFT